MSLYMTLDVVHGLCETRIRLRVNYAFVYRLDLSAAGEVSELMDNAAYEAYLKECEEH